MLDLVSITDQKAMTTSLIVAEAFDKEHRNILRDISQLECSEEFSQLNFEPSAYMNRGKQYPCFNITRDGFTFLAMGFTGKKAAEFKERFIAAFNAMEQALREGQGERKQIDINHSRGVTNPHGLDVKYTLDLTKLVMKPSVTGLKLLSRLTGLDLDDLAAELEAPLAQTGGLTPSVVNFARDSLIDDPGAWIEIEAIHNAYAEYCAEREQHCLDVSRFCRELRQIFPGIVRTRSSQGRRLWGYGNLRLLGG